MKDALIFLCNFLLAGLLSFSGPASPAMSAEMKGVQGTEIVKNFIEKTEHSYMFVYPAENNDNIQTGGRRRISVKTLSQKPAGAGPEAKKCVHEIEITPGDTEFKLNTGEEVVMIDMQGGNDPLLLGTVEYGYGNAADVIRLYNEKGQYLGMVKGINMAPRADQGKIIAQPFYLKNAIEDRGVYYIILSKENSKNEYETLVLKKVSDAQRAPFSISVPDKGKCSEWYIEEFIKNGDGLNDLIIKLKGVSCSNKEGTLEKYLKCSMAQ